MKIETKKEFDKHSRETRKTGGGKAPFSRTQISRLVSNIIPASVRPLENEYDDYCTKASKKPLQIQQFVPKQQSKLTQKANRM